MPTVKRDTELGEEFFLVNSKNEVLCAITCGVDGIDVWFYPYQGTEKDLTSNIYTRFLMDYAGWYCPKDYRDILIHGMLTRGVTREDISSQLRVFLDLRYVPSRLCGPKVV